MKSYIIEVQGTDGQVQKLMVQEGSFVSLAPGQRLLQVEEQKFPILDQADRPTEQQGVLYQEGGTQTLTVFSNNAVMLAKIFVPEPAEPIRVANLPNQFGEASTRISPLFDSTKELLESIQFSPETSLETKEIEGLPVVGEGGEREVVQEDSEITLHEKESVDDLKTTAEPTRFEVNFREKVVFTREQLEQSFAERFPHAHERFHRQHLRHHLDNEYWQQEELRRLEERSLSRPPEGNRAPVNTVPGDQFVGEERDLVFNVANGNRILVNDIDTLPGTIIQVMLTSTNGAMMLGPMIGDLTFLDGNGTSMITARGTIGAINTALNGLKFKGDLNYNGPASIQIQTNDLDNRGPLTDTDTINITVRPINDAPQNIIPGAQAIGEDLPLVFNAANGNQISITDPEAGPGVEFEVTLTATNGVMTLGRLVGLTFTNGDGTNDGTMTFTGTRAAINAALEGLTFVGLQNFNGAAGIEIQTNDQGNSGAGGAQTDTDTIDITVNPINDAPVNTVPGAQTAELGVELIFSDVTGNQISIADVDARGDPLQVTLTATNGLMTLARIGGLTFSRGDGTGDVMMTFTGSIAAINAALNGMTFVGGILGPASIQIDTNDQGNNGAGSAQTDTDTVSIEVIDGALGLVADSGNNDNDEVVFIDGDDAELLTATEDGWAENNKNTEPSQSVNSPDSGSSILFVDPDNSSSSNIL